ncbi:MAG: MFS transporter [Patescibacteria group bacterium]
MFQNINTIIKRLIFVDFFFNSALGTFAPIFAIFITRQITDGSASVVGMATAVFWIVKSIVQLPVARFLDKTKGEKDDFWTMFCGYIISALVPLGYLFVTKPWHLYVVQGIYGFAMALAVPSWYAIFTRHVDEWRISFEWSLQSVFSFGIPVAISAAVGGYIVDAFGFQVLFVIASVIAVGAALLQLPLRHEIRHQEDGQKRIFPERHIK